VPLILGALFSCLGFALLTVAHNEHWEIYAAMAVMGIGIGFAFSSMANLIVESVPASQTGVATGMNTIVRTIGGAIGSQVSAAIVAATLAVNGEPTERGFTIAVRRRGGGSGDRRRGRAAGSAAGARELERSPRRSCLEASAQSRSTLGQVPLLRQARRARGGDPIVLERSLRVTAQLEQVRPHRVHAVVPASCSATESSTARPAAGPSAIPAATARLSVTTGLPVSCSSRP
jgi:Major Facilitator Superfamily.